jgi:hypothetical protein
MLKCQRCQEFNRVFKMSWYNEQRICLTCSRAEIRRADYRECRRKGLEAIHQGNFNYHFKPDLGKLMFTIKENIKINGRLVSDSRVHTGYDTPRYYTYATHREAVLQLTRCCPKGEFSDDGLTVVHQEDDATCRVFYVAPLLNNTSH